MRRLRGTPFDIFGYTAERRTERKLIADYEALMGEVLSALTPETRRLAIDLASIPAEIRGFGHVKERSLAQAKAREAELLAAFRAPPAQKSAAE